MLKVWKKGIFLSIAFATPVYAFNTIILNYADLVETLETGNNVTAIVSFERCTITEPANPALFSQNLEGASTRFNFDHYLHYQTSLDKALKDTVVTSFSQLVKSTDGVFLTSYASLQLYADNSAIIQVSFFNPVSYKKQFFVEWSCSISNGKDTNGLTLYNSP